MKKRLNEYLVVSYKELWNPISTGFEDVWKAMKLAAKDIWSSLKYAFQITTTLDEEKIKKIKDERRNDIVNYSKEYSSMWKSLVEANPDFSTIAFVASPAAYMAAYLAHNGRSHALSVEDFVKDVMGSKDGDDKDSDEEKDKESKEKDIRKKMLMGSDSTTMYTKTRVQKELKSISKELGNFMGMSNFSILSEGVDSIRILISEAGENQLSSKIMSSEFKDALSKKIDSKKILAAKKEELKNYIEALNAPMNFAEIVKKASGIDGIMDAYKSMQSSILEIKGLEDQNPTQKIKKIAEENYSKISRDPKKTEDILKAAGVNVDYSKLKDEDKKKVLLAAIIKVQTLKEVEQIQNFVSGPEFLKALEPAKDLFIQSFRDGLSDEVIETMKKTNPNDEYIQVLSKGIESIKNAGLRK